MELVYLWIKEYKNIKEQGFNFSPRFKCSFDGEMLTIDEKKEDEYIKDFFGKNINVTAIVGKNGSGKSSVLSFLFNYMSNNKFEKDFIIIIKDSYLKCFSSSKIKTNIDYQLLNTNQSSIFLEKYFRKMFIDYSLDDNKSSNTTKYFYPNKNKTIYEIQEEDKRLLKRYMIDSKHNKNVNFIADEIIFTYDINIKETFYKKIDNLLWKDIETYVNKYNNDIEFNRSKNKPKFRIVKLSILLYSLKIIITFPQEWQEEIVWEKSNSENNFLERLYTFLIKNIKSIESKLEEPFLKINILNPYEYIYTLKNLLKIYIYLEKEKEIIELFISDIYDINFYKLEFGIKINTDTTILLKNLPLFFTHDYRDSLKKIKYSYLSTGEKSFLLYSSVINYFIDNTITNYFILLDEPLNTFHPSWQQQFLQYLIKNYKDINSHLKFHFIITSHSPFLLSDIPKQNIIFLDKDKDGNCKVVDGLKDKKQTFGANIHTLLSDGFFMEDGLMGEFAKEKINDVIQFLTDKDSDIKDKLEAKKIIDIVGEPFLKQKLTQMYFDKFNTQKEDRIKELKAELQRLENG